MSQKCPVCMMDLDGPVREVFESSAKEYNCRNCGPYALSFEAQHMGPSLENRPEAERALLSHSIRKMAQRSRRPLITRELIVQVLRDQKLPTPTEQVENLLLWLGDSLGHWGEQTQLLPQTHTAVIGAVNVDNFYAVGKELLDRGLFHGSEIAGAAFRGTLSLAGWRAYQKLMRGASASRRGFMAMPYGNALLDSVFAACFKPAAKLAGFDLQRLDESPPAGLIDARLRVEVRTSRFVVADLTDENPGVYWEAGYAEGLGKPVIYTCRRRYFDEHGTHFDTSHHHTVPWDEAGLDGATTALTATIRATLPNEAVLETPEHPEPGKQ